MDMRIIKAPINKADLAKIANDMEWSFVKTVVDVTRGIMAIGADMHVDEEQVLLRDGSKQQDLWGINLYPNTNGQDWLEFDSMINVRPWQGNRSRGVENETTQALIRSVVERLVSEV